MLKKKKKCYNQGRGVCPLVDYGGNMKKRVISIIRNIFDGVMIFVLFITTTVYALPSNGVIYDNSNSGSSATNVSEAIDDLYSKLTTKDNEINRLKGLGNVASNQMLKGYTALVKGNLVTGSIPSKGATTYTPGTQNQTIASGNYLSGTQTIKGDANLVAGNIAKGKSIFGITGSYTSDANAVAGNILSGKTAYVNGAKISGTMIDRGLAQSGNWGCGSAGCGTGNDAYYAINGLPEGWYHSDGNSWAPEARINANTLRSQLGVNANKIAKGQSIAGVAGSYTSDANATAADIAVGKTAYVNGVKITGNMSSNLGNLYIITTTSTGQTTAAVQIISIENGVHKFTTVGYKSSTGFIGNAFDLKYTGVATGWKLTFKKNLICSNETKYSAGQEITWKYNIKTEYLCY